MSTRADIAAIVREEGILNEKHIPQALFRAPRKAGRLKPRGDSVLHKRLEDALAHAS
ncbi:hypothetical protein ABZ915_45580 [Streptomyces sp. NPDC046915]|uniref:hypothetical protein n=1 Tax=Streptomyces sp. NPDC046915 TaxID=3155257 RepID=UPI0033D71C6E